MLWLIYTISRMWWQKMQEKNAANCFCQMPQQPAGQLHHPVPPNSPPLFLRLPATHAIREDFSLY